jgi:hypothetical protein
MSDSILGKINLLFHKNSCACFYLNSSAAKNFVNNIFFRTASMKRLYTVNSTTERTRDIYNMRIDPEAYSMLTSISNQPADGFRGNCLQFYAPPLSANRTPKLVLLHMAILYSIFLKCMEFSVRH